MSFRDLMYETKLALTANKMRSFLTILGIVIGISSVIMMVALVQGYQNVIFDQMGGTQASTLMVNGPLDAKIFDKIETSVEGVESTEFQLPANVQSVSNGDKNPDAFYGAFGVTPEYAAFQGLKMDSGEWITQRQNDQASRSIVLGKGIAQSLFGKDVDAVGKTVTVNKEKYTVVGVLSTSGQSMEHSVVYVPMRTAQTRLGAIPGGYVSGFVRFGKGADMAQAKISVQSFLDKQFPNAREGDINVESFDELIQSVKTVLTTLSLILGAIAGISLLVGGIGIMNMMLTTVTERIREIGLRKALGAKRRAIVAQFLTESIVLCIIGGLLGLLFGWLGAEGAGFLMRTFAADQVGNFRPVISVWSVVLAIGVSTLIGLVFGSYPAKNAAKLDPIEALRFQ